MNDELKECYDLLGLNPGASAEELKVAYRDLAKVWHPDRFLHDPRLQEKAQEKLKEINEAYDQLRSGKAKRQTHPEGSTNARRSQPPPGPFDQYGQAYPQTGSVAVVRRVRGSLILAPVLIFAAVFLATYSSLLRTSEQQEQSQASALEQSEAPPNPESQPSGGRDNTSASELSNGTDRIKTKSQAGEPVSPSTSELSAAPVPPMTTVTVVIDPYTGMIAGPDCPLKSKMTYPSGSAPHQRCTALHPKKTAPADAPVPKDSRIKSVAKRLASPGKWFGDGAKPDAGTKQDPKAP